MSLAESRQAVSAAADVTSSYRSNPTDTTMAGLIASNNRSLQDNRNETTETCNSSSALRAPSCSLINSSSENHSNSVQQQNCNTLLNGKHGDRQLQDCGLIDVPETAFSSTAHLFSVDDTSSGKTVLNHLHECVKSWRQTLPDSSNETHVMPTGITQTETSTQNLDETKAYLNILRNALFLAVNISTLESFHSRVRNISTMFLYTCKYDKGEMAVQEFDNYLTQLESMVQSIMDFNISLELYNLSTVYELSWVNCMLPLSKWELELQNERHRYREVRDVFIKVKVLEVFRRYVDPAVYFAILVVSLVWNGVLLFIFAMHRQFWTSANIMLFNLAVGDILSIVLNLPFFYFAHYHVQYFQTNEYLCKFYITLRPLFVAASALSVVALSILRYVASGKSLTVYSREGCKLSKRSRTVLYVIVVWILAIGLAAPYSFVLDFTAGKCFMYGDGYTAKMVALSEFVFYCVILPCIMIRFNVLTARNLRDSTRTIASAMRRNGQDLIRNRSANVLTALIVVFLISYVPQHLWRMFYRWLNLDIWNVPYRCIDKVTYYMLFANCCFNPISLYVVSKRFRKLFNHYFLYLYNRHRNKS
jgi:hypothetical protein